MPTIDSLTALEILDSRGKPTIQVTSQLASGATGTASVPSGASTGAAEALELRDGDPNRYRGMGCRKAVANVEGELNDTLRGHDFTSQAELDRRMIELDGTPNKSRVGANAILGVSLAFARACAAEQRIPLYDYFTSLLSQPLFYEDFTVLPEPPPAALPRPMINLFSGGKHAGGQVAIQDIQVMPVSVNTIDDLLAMTADVFHAAASLIHKRFGMRLLRADEGGLAPTVASSEAMLELVVESIEAAGLKPGTDVALTVDVAASHFYDGSVYHLDGETLDGSGMVSRLLAWIDRYPIVSIEDGLAEDDWTHWEQFYARAADRVYILGDDLLCTNPARIERATSARAANALLLKVNQIGTLTEAAQARRLARIANWYVVVSARSGETEDDWLADLAIGWSADHIKVGSITQSERLAKYNRLLAIERAMGLPLAAQRINRNG